MKDPIKYNVIETDEYCIGYATDLLEFFRKEIFDYYIDAYILDYVNADCEHIRSMLGVMQTLIEYKGTSSLLKIYYGRFYEVEIYDSQIVLGMK